MQNLAFNMKRKQKIYISGIKDEDIFGYEYECPVCGYIKVVIGDACDIQCPICAKWAKECTQWVKECAEQGDLISRKAVCDKLKEHHDFFINSYDGFENLSPVEKARVDEILACIAVVMNEPSVMVNSVECADVISREAVLKKQYRIDDSATLSTRDVVNVEDIEDAPSVTTILKQASAYDKQSCLEVKEHCDSIEYDTVGKNYKMQISNGKELEGADKENYKKALNRLYKPTGMNVDDLFDESVEEIDFVQEHKKIPVMLDCCVDAISREDTYNLMRSLTRWCVRSEDGKFNNVGLLYDDVMFGIDKLSPVIPSRLKGHWILKQQGDRYADYYCSECGNELNLAYCTIKDEQKKGRCLYCDHCGAEMESEE